MSIDGIITGKQIALPASIELFTGNRMFLHHDPPPNLTPVTCLSVRLYQGLICSAAEAERSSQKSSFVSSTGAWYPRGLCGLSVLYSFRQRSISTLASKNVSKISLSSNSSHNIPLNDSLYKTTAVISSSSLFARRNILVSQGLLGSMNKVFTSTF